MFFPATMLQYFSRISPIQGPNRSSCEKLVPTPRKSNLLKKWFWKTPKGSAQKARPGNVRIQKGALKFFTRTDRVFVRILFTHSFREEAVLPFLMLTGYQNFRTSNCRHFFNAGNVLKLITVIKFLNLAIINFGERPIFCWIF